MKILHNIAVVALLVLPVSAVQAQANPLVGKWTLALVVGMRMDGTEHTPVMGEASFVVEAKGDSLIGSMTQAPPEGRPQRPATRFAAKAVEGEVMFVVHTQSTISVNGEESVKNVTSTWKLSAKGDALAGTVDRQIEGLEAPNGGPQPVKGMRVKS
ncbi:MAG: hypothetical protein ABIZ70_11025 [Gemmatimonadales bacterium]